MARRIKRRRIRGSGRLFPIAKRMRDKLERIQAITGGLTTFRAIEGKVGSDYFSASITPHRAFYETWSAGGRHRVAVLRAGGKAHLDGWVNPSTGARYVLDKITTYANSIEGSALTSEQLVAPTAPGIPEPMAAAIYGLEISSTPFTTYFYSSHRSYKKTQEKATELLQNNTAALGMFCIPDEPALLNPINVGADYIVVYPSRASLVRYDPLTLHAYYLIYNGYQNFTPRDNALSIYSKLVFEWQNPAAQHLNFWWIDSFAGSHNQYVPVDNQFTLDEEPTTTTWDPTVVFNDPPEVPQPCTLTLTNVPTREGRETIVFRLPFDPPYIVQVSPGVYDWSSEVKAWDSDAPAGRQPFHRYLIGTTFAGAEIRLFAADHMTDTFEYVEKYVANQFYPFASNQYAGGFTSYGDSAEPRWVLSASDLYGSFTENTKVTVTLSYPDFPYEVDAFGFGRPIPKPRYLDAFHVREVYVHPDHAGNPNYDQVGGVVKTPLYSVARYLDPTQINPNVVITTSFVGNLGLVEQVTPEVRGPLEVQLYWADAPWWEWAQFGEEGGPDPHDEWTTFTDPDGAVIIPEEVARWAEADQYQWIKSVGIYYVSQSFDYGYLTWDYDYARFILPTFSSYQMSGLLGAYYYLTKAYDDGASQLWNMQNSSFSLSTYDNLAGIYTGLETTQTQSHIRILDQGGFYTEPQAGEYVRSWHGYSLVLDPPTYNPSTGLFDGPRERPYSDSPCNTIVIGHTAAGDKYNIYTPRTGGPLLVWKNNPPIALPFSFAFNQGAASCYLGETPLDVSAGIFIWDEPEIAPVQYRSRVAPIAAFAAGGFREESSFAGKMAHGPLAVDKLAPNVYNYAFPAWRYDRAFLVGLYAVNSDNGAFYDCIVIYSEWFFDKRSLHIAAVTAAEPDPVAIAAAKAAMEAEYYIMLNNWASRELIESVPRMRVGRGDGFEFTGGATYLFVLNRDAID